MSGGMKLWLLLLSIFAVSCVDINREAQGVEANEQRAFDLNIEHCKRTNSDAIVVIKYIGTTPYIKECWVP